MELPGEPVAEVGRAAHWGKDCMFRGVCVCGFFKLGGGQKLVEDGLGRPAGREGALEERR